MDNRPITIHPTTSVKRTFGNRTTSSSYPTCQAKRAVHHQRSSSNLPTITLPPIGLQRTRSLPLLSDIVTSIATAQTFQPAMEPATMDPSEEIFSAYEESFIFSPDVEDEFCKAWVASRARIAEAVLDLEPEVNFFLGITRYQNRIRTSGGDAIFGYVDRIESTNRIKEIIAEATKNTGLEKAEIMIDYGGIQYPNGVGGEGNRSNSLLVRPGMSIALAGRKNSGTLGAWIPGADIFITNCHVVEPEKISSSPLPHHLGNGEVLSPSDSDFRNQRQELVAARAEAQKMFLDRHFMLYNKPVMAEHCVRSILMAEEALKRHDRSEQGGMRMLGTVVAGWRGCVEEKKDRNKSHWVDVAVAVGDPDRRDNELKLPRHEVIDLDKVVWKDPLPGQKVCKSGRSTGLTNGHVGPSEGVMKVRDKRDGRYMLTTESYILPGDPSDVRSRSTEFSRSGDSGSAILAADGSAIVGVMFASGISSEGRLVDVTYFMPASRVAGAVNTLLKETVLKSLTPMEDFNLIHTSKQEPRIVWSANGEKLVATDEKMLAAKDNEKSATEEERKTTEQSAEEEKNETNGKSGKKMVEEVEKEKASPDINWDDYPEFKKYVPLR